MYEPFAISLSHRFLMALPGWLPISPRNGTLWKRSSRDRRMLPTLFPTLSNRIDPPRGWKASRSRSRPSRLRCQYGKRHGDANTHRAAPASEEQRIISGREMLGIQARPVAMPRAVPKSANGTRRNSARPPRYVPMPAWPYPAVGASGFAVRQALVDPRVQLSPSSRGRPETTLLLASFRRSQSETSKVRCGSQRAPCCGTPPMADSPSTRGCNGNYLRPVTRQGTPDRRKIVETILADKIGEMVQRGL